MTPSTPSNSNDDAYRILLLGDGNFSFALALARRLWQAPDPRALAHAGLGGPEDERRERTLLHATSFDTRAQLLDKYGDAKDILAALADARLAARVAVEHGVNAWDLPATLAHRFPCGFDRIIWNHPHLGTEDFRLHRFLMAHFFDSVAQVLRTSDPSTSDESIDDQRNRRGCVSISLVEGQETRWDVVRQAQRAGLGLIEMAWFDESLWPGYVVKRNKHGGSFKNVHTRRHVGTAMQSCYFTFAIGPGIDPDAVPQLHRKLMETRGCLSYASLAGNSPAAQPGRHLDAPSPSAADSSVDVLSESIRMLNMGPNSSAESGLGTTDATHTDAAAASDAGDSDVSTSETKRHRRRQPKPSAAQPLSRKAMRKAAIPANLICPHCSKQMASDRAYTQHVHMVHELALFGRDWAPVRSRSLACESCPKVFATQADLWQHQISKHTSLDPAELPSAPDNAHLVSRSDPDAVPAAAATEHTEAADNDYDYVPCDVCGQAVVRRDWGMLLHLESLKPALGLNMECPLCHKTFIEQRALYQHYKFCRMVRESSGSVKTDDNINSHADPEE